MNNNKRYESEIEIFRHNFSKYFYLPRKTKTRIKDLTEQFLIKLDREKRDQNSIIDAIWKATKIVYKQDRLLIKISRKEIEQTVKNNFK